MINCFGAFSGISRQLNFLNLFKIEFTDISSDYKNVRTISNTNQIHYDESVSYVACRCLSLYSQQQLMILFSFLDVTEIKTVLDTVSTTSSELKTEAKSLETRLNDIRSDLQRIKDECKSTSYHRCDEIDGAGLVQIANFSNLPSVDGELQSMRDILNQNFTGAADTVCFSL